VDGSAVVSGDGVGEEQFDLGGRQHLASPWSKQMT
jgi:hypothetical protein